MSEPQPALQPLENRQLQTEIVSTPEELISLTFNSLDIFDGEIDTQSVVLLSEQIGLLENCYALIEESRPALIRIDIDGTKQFDFEGMRDLNKEEASKTLIRQVIPEEKRNQIKDNLTARKKSYNPEDLTSSLAHLLRNITANTMRQHLSIILGYKELRTLKGDFAFSNEINGGITRLETDTKRWRTMITRFKQQPPSQEEVNEILSPDNSGKTATFQAYLTRFDPETRSLYEH